MHLKNKMLTSQLLMCCVNLKIEGCFTFLPPQVIGQQLALEGLTRLGQLILVGTWELLEQKDWEPHKFQVLFLWRW
jgi:hypothetical protein